MFEVIDGQIHVWEADSSAHPWDQSFAQSRRSFLEYGEAVTIERALGGMDAVGVSAALVTSIHLYRDISYALAAAERHPDRFALVPQIDLRVPGPARLVPTYAAEPSVVAIRLSLLADSVEEHRRRVEGGIYESVISAVESAALPLMVVVSGNPLAAEAIVKNHPGLQVIIDHLGLVQGPNRNPPRNRFAGFDELLSLSKYANVAVKVSGAPTLSTSGYPYKDLWPNLHRLIAAYGCERLMWGSDFSRTRPLHNYAEALGYLKYSDELSRAEKEAILSGTLRNIVRWPRQ